MNRIREDIIEKLIQDKIKGKSIRELAREYKLGKNTVAFYCKGIERPHKEKVEKVPKQKVERPKKTRKLYPCKKCHTMMVKKRDGLCVSCLREARKVRMEERQRVEDARKKEVQVRRAVYFAERDKQAIKLGKCNKSPTGAHYWVIDEHHVGECKYCKQKKVMAVEDKYIDNVAVDVLFID